MTPIILNTSNRWVPIQLWNISQEQGLKNSTGNWYLCLACHGRKYSNVFNMLTSFQIKFLWKQETWSSSGNQFPYRNASYSQRELPGMSSESLSLNLCSHIWFTTILMLPLNLQTSCLPNEDAKWTKPVKERPTCNLYIHLRTAGTKLLTNV